MAATTWQKRVDSGDWGAITAEVNDFGGALLPRLLTKAEAVGNGTIAVLPQELVKMPTEIGMGCGPQVGYGDMLECRVINQVQDEGIGFGLQQRHHGMSGLRVMLRQ